MLSNYLESFFTKLCETLILIGQLLTNRTWNYKTPGAKDIPIDFRVKFIETDNTSDRVSTTSNIWLTQRPNKKNFISLLASKVGVLRSKATGEPAVTLAVVVVCALRHALSSVLKDNGNEDVFLQMGMICSNVLMISVYFLL